MPARQRSQMHEALVLLSGIVRFLLRMAKAFGSLRRRRIAKPVGCRYATRRTAFELADKRTTRSYAAHSGGRVGVGRATWPIHAAMVLLSGIVSGLPDFAERDGDVWKPLPQGNGEQPVGCRYAARNCVGFELAGKATTRSPSYAVYGRTAFELADKSYHKVTLIFARCAQRRAGRCRPCRGVKCMKHWPFSVGLSVDCWILPSGTRTVGSHRCGRIVNNP